MYCVAVIIIIIITMSKGKSEVFIVLDAMRTEREKLKHKTDDDSILAGVSCYVQVFSSLVLTVFQTFCTLSIMIFRGAHASISEKDMHVFENTVSMLFIAQFLPFFFLLFVPSFIS